MQTGFWDPFPPKKRQGITLKGKIPFCKMLNGEKPNLFFWAGAQVEPKPPPRSEEGSKPYL